MKKHLMILLICGVTLAVVSTVGGLLYAQWRDTDDLIRYAETIFEGKVPYEDTRGTRLGGYNWAYEGSPFDGEYVEVDLNRKFVLHNFSDGYIWLSYTKHYFDKSSGKYVDSSEETFSLWKIHKTENGWEVVEIIERP